MDVEVGIQRGCIVAMLAEAGLVDPEDLEKALAEHRKSGERLVNILISQGMIDAHDFVKFLAHSHRLDDPEIRMFDIVPEIIELVPKNVALMNEVMPIRH